MDTNKLKLSLDKKSALPILVAVVVFAVFLFLVFSIFKSSFFPEPSSNSKKGGVYLAPGRKPGEEIFYDPEEVTEEDIKRILEEDAKLHEFIPE